MLSILLGWFAVLVVEIPVTLLVIYIARDKQNKGELIK